MPTNSRTSRTRIYYLPLMSYYNSEIILCQHKHTTLELAQKCLTRKTKNFQATLKQLSKRKLKRFTHVTFYIREIQLKQVWATTAEIDHNLQNGKRLRYQDNDKQQLFGYYHAPHLPVGEIKRLIDNYHDQKQRTRRASLADYFPFQSPPCLISKPSTRIASKEVCR